ncbi:MAG: HAD family phosphatase [Pirellulales bacterium]
MNMDTDCLDVVRAVAFDMDGLLVNTEELYEEVGDRLLQRRGHRMTDDLLTQMIGRPSRVALPMMIDWYGLSDSVQQLEEETESIFMEILPEGLAPMPGIVELLHHVERLGLPKVVATSSRLPFAHRVLSQLEWLPRFEFLLTSESVEHGKPHPEIYLTAAQRLGVTPAQLLVLEDSHNGCKAAVAAGACAVAVPHRRTSSHDFTGVRFIADTAHDPRIRQLLGEI